MTKREFYAAVIENVTVEEIKDMAQELLEAMDKTNSARRVKAEEKKAEKAAAEAPIYEAIKAVLTDEPKTATTIIEEAGLDLKPQKVSYMMRALIADGIVVKEAVKVAGKGSHMGYRAAE